MLLMSLQKYVLVCCFVLLMHLTVMQNLTKVEVYIALPIYRQELLVEEYQLLWQHAIWHGINCLTGMQYGMLWCNALLHAFTHHNRICLHGKWCC